MKSLVEHLLSEAVKNILHFKDIYSYALFKCEYSGQISDGKYENSRPYDHWKWLNRTEYIIDGKEYYEGNIHRLNYNFGSWDKYIKRALKGQKFDYDFTVRDFYICKFISILPESTAKELLDSHSSAISSIAETWGEAILNNQSYNQMIESNPFYRTYNNYKTAVDSIDNEQNFIKFSESKYDINDFISARESAERSMNNYEYGE